MVGGEGVRSHGWMCRVRSHGWQGVSRLEVQGESVSILSVKRSESESECRVQVGLLQNDSE